MNARTIRIERIGADGDGVGYVCDGPRPEGLGEGRVYIPLTLPGETILARISGDRGTLEAVAEPSPDRVEPPCQHFGTCGGCALQHWRHACYIRWKTAQLEAALHRAGFAEAEVGSVARTPPRTRRRIDLAIRRTGTGIAVGLHRSRSADVVDLQTCLVIDPILRDLIAPLRTALGEITLLRRDGSAIVNLLDSGPDLLLRTDTEPTTLDRTALTRFARANGIARIAWARGNGAPEPICVLRPTVTQVAGIAVAPPPGGFLQPTLQGEQTITDAVLAGIDEAPSRQPIVELYCGCGAITFALATRARVLAFDGDAAAIASLRNAANQAGLAGRITAAARDLARQPLTTTEIGTASAVVLDPPYAGAIAQMPAIAAAKPKRVAYVSCNPAALARDARLLRDAGYRLRDTGLIDQFLWSSRIESVSVFTR